MSQKAVAGRCTCQIFSAIGNFYFLFKGPPITCHDSEVASPVCRNCVCGKRFHKGKWNKRSVRGEKCSVFFTTEGIASFHCVVYQQHTMRDMWILLPTPKDFLVESESCPQWMVLNYLEQLHDLQHFVFWLRPFWYRWRILGEKSCLVTEMTGRCVAAKLQYPRQNLSFQAETTIQ